MGPTKPKTTKPRRNGWLMVVLVALVLGLGYCRPGHAGEPPVVQ